MGSESGDQTWLPLSTKRPPSTEAWQPPSTVEAKSGGVGGGSSCLKNSLVFIAGLVIALVTVGILLAVVAPKYILDGCQKVLDPTELPFLRSSSGGAGEISNAAPATAPQRRAPRPLQTTLSTALRQSWTTSLPSKPRTNYSTCRTCSNSQS